MENLSATGVIHVIEEIPFFKKREINHKKIEEMNYHSMEYEFRGINRTCTDIHGITTIREILAEISEDLIKWNTDYNELVAISYRQ